jgi:hypothetical protein
VTTGPTAVAGGRRRRTLREILLRRFLERDRGEIGRRADRFAIATAEGRRLVTCLGEAFIGGYNAMLGCATMSDVAAQGGAVDPHFRPFFFEGAAMGYLPRGYLTPGFAPESAERDLLKMDPRFLYLYYVGLGFWYGIRHPRDPALLERFHPHLNPIYLPLCYDGFGFKVGFFDHVRNPEARRRLDRCPSEYLSAAHQGFGRSLFFVYMSDPEGFRRTRDAAGRHGDDLEFGRSLALAFTGIDRLQGVVDHLLSAGDEAELRARLTGVTWALAAREMNDPEYFRRCVASAPTAWRDLLPRLPALCREALAESRTYSEWQSRTADAVTAAYAASPPST